MPSYAIYPVKGKAAEHYLLSLGCWIDHTDRLNIPDSLLVKHNAGGTYAVRRQGETVFCLQYYPLDHWRVVLPVGYRLSFSELLQAYSIDESLAEKLIGSSGVGDLIRDLPVQRSLAGDALKWLSNYTGHPYDLENVRVALADSITPDCPMVQ